MADGYFLFCLLMSLAVSAFAFGGGLGDVADVGGKMVESGKKVAEGGSPAAPGEVDVSTWKECTKEIDAALELLRDVLKGQGNPMVIQTPYQFCEYIQIHNLDTLKRGGKCGSRKCLDGRKECFDQKLACAVEKLRFDCAFHSMETLKKWVVDQGFSLPTGVSSLLKRAIEDEKNVTTPSPSGAAGRYFLHAEAVKNVSLYFQLVLDWNSDEVPQVTDAGYSTGGLAEMRIFWTGDTAAASFLEWLTQTEFIRRFFGLFCQFALLFVMPGLLRQKQLTEQLAGLNCGD